MEYLFLYLSKYGKKALSQVSVDRSSGHLSMIELNVTAIAQGTVIWPNMTLTFDRTTF